MALALLFTAGVRAAEVKSMTNKILYVEKEKAGSTYLCAMDPDGANKRRLTPAFHNIVFPKYCEKSGWIAFTNQTDKMESEIYILNKNGDQLKKIITNAAFEDFSPDGKSFLYTTTDEKASLYMYNLSSKQATKISQDLKVTAANWSNDGEWIITSCMTNDGTLDLYLISCYAQGIIRATATPGVNEAFPMFSKDNRQVIYYSNKKGTNGINIMGVGEKNNLTTNDTELAGTHPSFSPDGKSFVYQLDNTILIGDPSGNMPQAIGKGCTPYWTK